MVAFSKKRFSDDKARKIIKEAKDHIFSYRTAYELNLQDHKSMVKFINGEQWEKEAIAAYKNANKIMLTFNKVRPYVKQIIGDDMDFTVDMMLRNVGANSEQTDQQESTQKEIKLYMGLLMNIAYHSKTQKIYNTAYVEASEGGFSAWRVGVEKEGEHNVLRVRPIKNIYGCYWDLTAKQTTKIDGDYAGTITAMTRDKFEQEYPDFPYPDPQSFTAVGEYNVEWGDDKKITICEEYRREKYKVKVYVLKDGTELDEEDFLEQKIKESAIKETRMDRRSRIVHYKFTDQYLLDKSETPFKDIPLVFVPAYIRQVDGLERTYSIASDARDAQRQLNYIGSDIAQWLKITKKTKFMVPAGTIDNWIQQWNNPDHADAALEYDAAAGGGFKPEAITPPPMPTDLIQQYSRAEQDIMIAFGRYEPNKGAPSNEQSGIAIYNRAMQGNTAQNEPRSNRNEAIADTGRLILNAIPKVYDDTRMIQITNESGEDQSVGINQPGFNPKTLKNEIIQTFSDNSYSIEVDVGASFPMQKAATANFVLDIIKNIPQSAPLIAEFIPECIDVQNADKIAARLRTLVPPDVLMAEDNPMPKEQQKMQAMQQAQQMQQIQAQQAQMQQQMQQLQLQTAQLANLKTQQDIMNEHILTISKATADMKNADTNRLKAQQEGVLDAMKEDAARERENQEATIAATKADAENMRTLAEMRRADEELELKKFQAVKDVF
jgi:hypothetical protein